MKSVLKPVVYLSSFLLVLLELYAGTAQGATFNWNGATSSDWATTTNWGVAGVMPTNGTYANRFTVNNVAANKAIYTADKGTTILTAVDRNLWIANGTLDITGGTIDARNATAGNQDAILIGALNILGGNYINNTASGAFDVLFSGTGTATLNIESGSFTSNILRVGGSGGSSTGGTATVNLNGGMLYSNIIGTNAFAAGANCTLNFNGGLLVERAAGGALGVQKMYVKSAGARIDVNSPGTMAVSGPLLDGSGGGGLTKSGTGNGLLTLNAANTYAGSTLIQGGTLALGAAGSINTSPLIDVASGATFNVSTVTGGYQLLSTQTLSGNGSIIGAVLANGTVAPGNSIGTLTFDNTLTLAGTTAMEIAKSTSLTSDLINGGANALAFGGTLNVVESGSVAYATGDSWNLFDAGSFSGSFGTVSLPTLSGGLSWDITKLSVDGTVSVVPEPGTLALLATGLFGLLAYAWRKRK